MVLEAIQDTVLNIGLYLLSGLSFDPQGFWNRHLTRCFITGCRWTTPAAILSFFGTFGPTKQKRYNVLNLHKYALFHVTGIFIKI